MIKYEKPVVMVQDSLMEGVYAASGDNAGEATYSLFLTNSWDGNKQYRISLTNNSLEKVDSITVTVKVTGEVTSIGGNVSGTVNGNTATITFSNYGNGIGAGETVTTDNVAVTGNGDFSLS